MTTDHDLTQPSTAGRLLARKQRAREQASAKGHDLGDWHNLDRYSSGAYTEAVATCRRCARYVMVDDDTREPGIHGTALTYDCQPATNTTAG